MKPKKANFAMSTSLEQLKTLIQTKQARLAVIGLGYVGLPLACSFAKAGFDVLGVERRPEVVNMINIAQSPIEGDEPGLAELLADVISNRQLEATTDYAKLSDRDVIFINVETPVDDQHLPRYEALKAVLNSLNAVLKKGALVIVESTIAPNTMYKLVEPALQSSGRISNQDFYLGCCPERVMPGKLLHNLRTMSRVIGGRTLQIGEVMADLYRYIVEGELDVTDCLTAELVKTVENTYRDVQIAFANEVAMICEATGSDVWRVRQLVNKSPGRQMLMPGAGVGGHCIPKDPWLLAASVPNLTLKVIPAARETNDFMPSHILNLIQISLAEVGQPLSQAKILIMGYAYLENSDDTRNSPSQTLVELLEQAGSHFVIHDPYVKKYQQIELSTLAQGCHAAVVMVKHQEYAELDLSQLASWLAQPILIDGRSVYNAQKAKEANLTYRVIGVGKESQA